MNFQTGEGMGSSRRRPLALSCRTDGPNNNQINAELNVSTRGANLRNRGGVNRCRQTARRRATSSEISLPLKGGSPCHGYASDASLRDVRMSIGTRDLWRPSQRQARALPKRIAGNQRRPHLARPPLSAGGP